MANVFLSYRRDDSWQAAQLVRDRLASWFSGGSIFMDVTGIEGGDDWRETLRQHLQRADAVVVLIGKTWLTCTDAHGRRRLDQPDDVVSWEVSEALRLGKRVIPVLVDGAASPVSGDLPAALRPLATRQCVGLSNVRFEKDIETLIEAIERRGRVADLLDESRRMLALLRRATILIPTLGVLMFSLAWLSLFDVLRLDTFTANLTMLLGDLVWPTEPSADVLLVALEDHPTTPGSTRRDDAALIEALSQLGARRVVLDVFYRDRSEFDGQLLESIRGARQRGTEVIVGFNDQDDGHPVGFPGLADTVSAMGAVCVARRLGLATAAALTVDRGGRILPALPLVAAHGPGTVRRVRYDLPEIDLDGATTRVSVRYSTLERIGEARSRCPALAENDVGTFMLFPISRRDVLRTPARQKAAADVMTRRRGADPEFGGKIVLVGARQAGDKVRTRLDLAGARYGFEFQADAVSALLRGTVVRTVSAATQWSLMLLLGAAAVTLRLWRFGQDGSARLVMAVAVLVAYTTVAVLAYLAARVLLNLVYQVATFVAAYWILGRVQRRSRVVGG